MRKLSFLIALFCSFQFIAQKQLSLEEIWLKYAFMPKGAQDFNVMKDGVHYTDLDENDGVRVISKFQMNSGKKVSDLINGSDIKYKARTIELNNYEFSPNEDKILIAENGEAIYRRSYKADYYVFDIKTKVTYPVSDAGKIMFPTFSPDGRKIAFVRDNNLFIRDLVINKEIQVTWDGAMNKIKNGWGDWVYEEEFSKADYFTWSANSQFLAYVKFDESHVKEFTMEIYKGDLYPEHYTYKYPKAGEDNSIVSCWIYDVNAFDKTRQTVKADIGEEIDIYIPRIQFTNDNNVLSIQRLNRLQNKLELLMVNSTNGQSKVVYTDEAKTYVDITDDLTFIGNKGFIISSEKDEFNHLYYYDLNGKLINQITSGTWDVIEFKGYDDKSGNLYYISTERGAINRDLYSIKIDGKGKKRLSEKEGFNTADFTYGFKYYIASHSDANTPPAYELRDGNGKLLKVLESNLELKEKLKNYALAKKEFLKIKNKEGTELNAWMMKPANFEESKKYPVYMYAYNGPGSNECNNSWEGFEHMWHQLLCQEGYIVVCVDGRGTLGRGRQFKHSTYLQLGKFETEDQIDAAVYLGNLPYIDKTRIGFQGWSYGGYMASLMITKGAEVIKAAVAVAPVTNWKYYDNIYTERFMRKPKDNKKGYEDNSPVNHVKLIKGKYLLIHGSADDNVHVQNSMEMAKALVANNIPFDFMIYPNKNHGISGGYTRYHIFSKILKFVKENL